MQAQAKMLVEFMEKQGHDAFHLICHDQGGAASQIIAATMPEKIMTLVLTNCVCYDNWPVPAISKWQTFARIPLIPEYLIQMGVVKWLETKTPLSAFRKGVYNPEKMTHEAIMEYLRPLHEDSKSRKLFLKFLLAGNSRYTLEVVSGLKKFTKPGMVIWAADDFYISPSWGKRLADDIPGVKDFELIPFCGHFWQEEKATEFSLKIGNFLASHTK
ncbi:alpha/beta hydrolase [Candidatus Magnetomorum sp. HK-1]|nr:alpha/beta hydrolase [Candidatus Magnetomorum sp. HK-1]